jgi:GT2 family glycosyltransferase
MAARLSVIVPVRNGAAFLAETLPALIAVRPAGTELLVGDDGSTDASARVAAANGARVVRTSMPAGPAAARNRAAREATGDILVFLDADVRIHRDTLDRLLSPFADRSVAATFGSYDDAPTATSWVSRYKNLAHHFVHQRSRREAQTFWAGCGAIRRPVFETMGGFDERYPRPSIEDVELGYRLRESGHRIVLVREATVTHLKDWTLANWLLSDLRDRAVPWARLVLWGRRLPTDLNFTTGDRLALALVAVALAAAFGAIVEPRLVLLSLLCLAGTLPIDARLLHFMRARGSLAFTVAAALLHAGHRIAAVTGAAVALLSYRRGSDRPAGGKAVDPLPAESTEGVDPGTLLDRGL